MCWSIVGRLVRFRFTSFSTWTPSISLLSVFCYVVSSISSPLRELRQADHIAEGKDRPQHRGLRALGPVCRKSRKLFGPEKPFVELPTACFGEPIFQHVFKVTKRKMTLKFYNSSALLSYKGNCDTRKWPVKFRDF